MITFLLDENITKLFKIPFEKYNYNVLHVSEVGLSNTPDEIIVDYAAENNLVIVTFDLDFSRIMALSHKSLPSVITFRIDGISEGYLDTIISSNFRDIIPSLFEGSLITINENNIRIKKLPIQRL
jgi:predicted nuclease of predicted toxin-antitoxin system